MATFIRYAYELREPPGTDDTCVLSKRLGPIQNVKEALKLAVVPL